MAGDKRPDEERTESASPTESIEDWSVWCPRDMPREEWDTRTNKDKVAWWQHHWNHPEPCLPLQTVLLYWRGIISLQLTRIMVLTQLMDGNVDRFFAECPADVRQQLVDACGKLPADEDEEGWSKWFYIAPSCNPTTDEDVEAEVRRGLRLFRRRIGDLGIAKGGITQ